MAQVGLGSQSIGGAFGIVYADNTFITPEMFGAVGDGVTDDTAAIQAALDALTGPLGDQVGGRIVFAPKYYLCLGKFVIINDGFAFPKQPPISLEGSGPLWSFRVPTRAGTVIDIRGADTHGKIVTTGFGKLDIKNICFRDEAATTTPWIYSTNTTLGIRKNAFYGSTTRSGVTCDQDVIILGGNTQVWAGGLDDGFQGYGTVIEQNFFDYVRRFVYGRTSANGNVVRDNYGGGECGSNLVAGACIEFDNPAVGATLYTSGNVIADNLIQYGSYPYAVKLGRTERNTVRGNNCFDGTVVTLGQLLLGASAQLNFFEAGYGHPGTPVVVDNSTTKDNVLILSDRILLDDGSNTLPSHSFAKDPDTGMWLFADGELAFGTVGAIKLHLADAIYPQVAVYAHDVHPATDDTYNLGAKPVGWKGVVVKDTTNGHWYRIVVTAGALALTDLGT